MLSHFLALNLPSLHSSNAWRYIQYFPIIIGWTSKKCGYVGFLWVTFLLLPFSGWEVFKTRNQKLSVRIPTVSMFWNLKNCPRQVVVIFFVTPFSDPFPWNLQVSSNSALASDPTSLMLVVTDAVVGVGDMGSKDKFFLAPFRNWETNKKNNWAVSKT